MSVLMQVPTGTIQEEKSIIKSIQRGTYNYTSRDSTTNISIREVNIAKTIVILNAIGRYRYISLGTSDVSYGWANNVKLESLSTNFFTVTATDGSFSTSTDNSSCAFSWQVIEFN